LLTLHPCNYWFVCYVIYVKELIEEVLENIALLLFYGSLPK